MQKGRNFPRIALAAVFFFSHIQFASADDKTCEPFLRKSDKQVKECLQGIDAAVAQGANASQGGEGGRETAELLQQQALTGAVVDQAGATQCQEAYEQCKKACVDDPKTKPDYKEKCNALNKFAQELQSGADQNMQTQNAAGETKDAASSGGGGGGMNPMMAGLLGAAAGGLLGYMMGKKAGEKEKEGEEGGALLPNGQIDCSKEDAYKYRDCDAQLIAKCLNAVDSAECANFNARFCTANSSGGEQSATTPEGVPLGQPGEGLGSPFCKKVQATSYCKTSGRDMCPSCLTLKRMGSEACNADPALCIAQNSPEQIAQAKQTCPTDPAFADPAYANGGGSQVPPEIAGGGLPSVVLPQSVGASGAGSAAINGAGPASASGGGAVREGYSNGVSGGGGGAGQGAGAVGGSAGGRELASASGRANYRTASTGPASDVQGEFSPSLFKTSSEVITKLCQERRLNNCP